MDKNNSSQPKNEVDEKVVKAFSEINKDEVESNNVVKVETDKDEVKTDDSKEVTKDKEDVKEDKKEKEDKKSKTPSKKSDSKSPSKKPAKKAEKKKVSKKQTDRAVRRSMAKRRKEIKRRNRKEFKSVIKDFFDAIEKQFKRLDAFIKRIFSVFGLIIDKSINSKSALKVIALALAVLLYIFVVEVPEERKITGNPELIRDIPVEISNPDELHVVEGLPDSADMLLVGTQADLLRAVNLKDYRVYIDLDGLGPGTHEVELGYSNIVKDINVTLTPAKVTLQIFKKVTDSLTLTTDPINLDKKDPKLVLNNIKLDTSEVTVRGADYQVEKIVGIKALIDASQIKNTGEVVLEDNQIIAYDAKGMPVEVEIYPKTVSATVEVTAPSKQLKVNVVTTGELPSGFAVEDFKPNPEFVTVYAPQDILDSLVTYDVLVDLSEFEVDNDLKDVVKQFTVEKPADVNQVLEEIISVTTSFSSETEVIIESVTISGVNVPDGLKVSGKTPEDVSVDVKVSGSSTILNDLTKDDIEVEVDLTDLEAGEHQVELTIKVKDSRVTYELQKEKVTLVLEKEE